jgi:hypothetical protein
MANPKYVLKNENSEYSVSFDMSSVEVIYNCLDKDSAVKMSMTISSPTCDTFTINWQKHCKAKGMFV